MNPYRPELKLWFEACDSIARADAPPASRKLAFDWLKSLLSDPRPYPAVKDAAYSAQFDQEIFFARIPGTAFDVIWGIDEPEKEIAVYQVGLHLDPLRP